MVNNKITDLGNNIRLNHDNGVESDSAYGNGVLKAGAIVSINETTGRVQGVDINSGDDAQLKMGGVLMPRSDTDLDDAIAEDDPVTVENPKSGGMYRVRITDPSGSYLAGHPMGYSATPGTLAIITDISDMGNVIAKLLKDIVSGDTVAEVIYR